MDKQNQDYYNNVMTEEMAREIVRLRTEEDCSWRVTCSKIEELFPGTVGSPGNQIEGMYMEYSANEFLSNLEDE